MIRSFPFIAILFAISHLNVYAADYEVLGIGAPCVDILLPIDEILFKINKRR